MQYKNSQAGRAASASVIALIVDDNPEYAQLLSLVLRRLGYRFELASTVAEARRRIGQITPDLVLLDGHLPDGNGLDLCREIRREARLSRALVIMLSAKKAFWQGKDWLNAGADQCWPKIFNVDRLSALITALMRRIAWDKAVTSPGIPGLSIDPAHRTIIFEGVASQKLGDREFAFLNLLFQAHPDTLSRVVIQSSIFALSRAEQFDLALNEFVRRLRKKLPENLAIRIEAVYRHGYRVNLPSAAVVTGSPSLERAGGERG